ncbi:hypothetical protein V2J09_002787 [Rumex salicifolius]
MGADGGAPSSAGHSVRVGAAGSSEIPPLPQCLPLDPISFGSQKYSPGELRRVLGYIGNASENHSFGASHYRFSPPAATEELKHYKNGVLDGFKKARERSEMFGESIIKLDKYREFIGSKKRQRPDSFSNEKLSGSNLLKMSQIPRSIHDHSTQKFENKSKSMVLNKRNRSPADLKVENKSSMISRDQISNEKGRDIPKIINGAGVQPEERIRSLSAMGEGWVKKVTRKRSVATVANRVIDSDGKQTIHSKAISDSKLPPIDPRNIRSNAVQSSSTGSPSPLAKGKASREPRPGPFMAVNSSSENQMSSDASEGWDSANKVQSINGMHNRQPSTNSLHSMTQWVGQRPHKISRTRRANVVSPIPNYEEADDISPSPVAPVFGVRKSSSANSGSLPSIDTDNVFQKSRIKQESNSPSNRLPEVTQTKDLDHQLKEKGQISAILSSNGKVRGTVFPTKKNRALGNEDTLDGSWRPGKVGRGLPLPKLGVLETGEKLENVSTTRSLPNVKPVNEKTKSKSGRPPSRKLSERKAFARAAESDDDREELLAAAASARVAYSGRFWKKMEPILGSVGSHDTGFLKEQLNGAEKLEESPSRICDADYDVLGVLMHNHKDDSLSVGMGATKKLDKSSSLYQRVLSALIEDDENEGISNGGEAISTSFQCASDDSHCGSCNYNDVEMRDRDRLESEAESIVDFQIQRCGAGDMFSCNRSVASNTSKNLSMSDSLYSSGRWQGDDGLSHSDVEFVSGIYQNDMGGSHLVDANVSGPLLSDCQYQLLCLDDKIVLELQSIGLYLDTIPDLADGEEEALDQDLKELNEGLKQEVGKKKTNLVKVDKALQDDRERERRFMEQLAMNQLVQMAYRKRMACRRSNGSRTMTRKVSRQVAMGFIERTLARCRKFELTGWSCFNEPALQKILFAPASSEAKSADCLGVEMQNNAGSEPPKHLTILGGSGPESSRADIKVSLGSPPVDSHSYGFSFSKDELALERGRKRELLLDDVGNANGNNGSFSRAPENALLGSAKGKRSDRERCNGRDTVMSNSVSVGGYPSPGTDNKVDVKLKPKANRKATDSVMPLKAEPSNFTMDVTEELEDPIDFSKMPPPEFESLEQLGVNNDLGGAGDFSSWLEDDGLQDYDSMGLEIPMDDISNLMLF